MASTVKYAILLYLVLIFLYFYFEKHLVLDDDKKTYVFPIVVIIASLVSYYVFSVFELFSCSFRS